MRGEESKVYGRALYSLAREEGLQRRILEEIEEIDPCFTEEYVRLLATPALPRETAEQIIGELLDGRVHPYLSSFVKLMTKRGLGTKIRHSFQAYEVLYDQEEESKRVIVESAFPLSEEQKARLEEKLRKHLKEPFEVLYRLSPSLLGGVRIECGRWEREDSLRGRLRALRNHLEEKKGGLRKENKQGEGE